MGQGPARWCPRDGRPGAVWPNARREGECYPVSAACPHVCDKEMLLHHMWTCHSHKRSQVRSLRIHRAPTKRLRIPRKTASGSEGWCPVYGPQFPLSPAGTASRKGRRLVHTAAEATSRRTPAFAAVVPLWSWFTAESHLGRLESFRQKPQVQSQSNGLS
jgi:hypothetical protein